MDARLGICCRVPTQRASPPGNAPRPDPFAKGDRRPADTTARLPTPVETEAAPMPAHRRNAESVRRMNIIDPGRRRIFRSVMRFTLCSFGDELNSRSPVKGRRTHIGRGARVDATWLRSTSTSRRFRARQPTPQYCPTSGVKNLARAHSHRRKAARWDLAILARYRPGRRPTVKCRVMFCEMVGSIALAGALDPEDLRGLIGLFPSPRRTIGGVVGGFRRPNTWEDRIAAAASLSLAAGRWRCSKRL